MKITILSGGSGNDSLIRGLKLLYKNIDVKVIVNAYAFPEKEDTFCKYVDNYTDWTPHEMREHKYGYDEFSMHYIRVRKDLIPGNKYGNVLYISSMDKFKDEECTITNMDDTAYQINNCGYWWTDEMLELDENNIMEVNIFLYLQCNL